MKKHQFLDRYPLPKRIILPINTANTGANNVPNHDVDQRILTLQRQLDWCYNSYLQHPIHQKMATHCQDYYETLKSLTKSQTELEQLSYTARLYAKEDALNDKLMPMNYQLDYDNFFGTKRGLRLEKFGFYPMYSYYDPKACKLASLYAYFDIREIKLFLNQHKHLLQGYIYRENENHIKAIYLELNQELQEEIELLKWELSQSELELEACRDERYQFYKIFFAAYTQLVTNSSAIANS